MYSDEREFAKEKSVPESSNQIAIMIWIHALRQIKGHLYSRLREDAGL